MPLEEESSEDLREHPVYKACEQLQGRLACPDNAVCDEAGAFHCTKGFRAEGLACVEREEITREAQRIAKNLEVILRERKGYHACGL